MVCIISNFKNMNTETLHYLKQNIRYEQAPEPEDIIYENVKTTGFIRVIKTILVFIIAVFICFVSLVIVASLNILQQYCDEKYEGHTYILFFISILITLILDLIDLFLEIILEKLTTKENHSHIQIFI